MARLGAVITEAIQTPHELVTIGEFVGFNGEDLAKTSRLVAKVDSAAVQDGFDLYLHGFIVTDDACRSNDGPGFGISGRGGSWCAVPVLRSSEVLTGPWRKRQSSFSSATTRL